VDSVLDLVVTTVGMIVVGTMSIVVMITVAAMIEENGNLGRFLMIAMIFVVAVVMSMAVSVAAMTIETNTTITNGLIVDELEEMSA
jgi:uncharacterized membrane protein